jgi:hypothetical protein
MASADRAGASSIVLQQPSGPLACPIDDQAAIELTGGIELIGGALRDWRATSTEPARAAACSQLGDVGGRIARCRPAFLGNARQSQNRLTGAFSQVQGPRGSGKGQIDSTGGKTALSSILLDSLPQGARGLTEDRGDAGTMGGAAGSGSDMA